MSDVRLLAGDDFDAFTTIAANAYPSFDLSSVELRQDLVQRMQRDQGEPTRPHLYGLFRDGALLGGMRLHDFTMTMVETPVPVGGVGMVAVDLMHKKEKVAKEMIAFYLRHYRSEGAPMTALYPFRPDFYKQMGFGYGSKMNQYRVHPSQLPKSGERQHVRLLNADDLPALIACYARTCERTHGLFAKSERDFAPLFEGFANRIIGYTRDGTLHGYSIFNFVKGANPLDNDIDIRDLVYEDREALAALLAFFQSQADQIKAIAFNTQDAWFHHLLLDPRNGGDLHVPPVAHESNRAGVGIMYRVVDTVGWFKILSKHSFGAQNCTLKFTVRDDFLPENDGSTLVRFRDGLPEIVTDEQAEAEIRLHIAEFSSLVMGVLPFSKLHLYGLAEISDPAHIPLVDRLFATPTPPVCMTRF